MKNDRRFNSERIESTAIFHFLGPTKMSTFLLLPGTKSRGHMTFCGRDLQALFTVSMCLFNSFSPVDALSRHLQIKYSLIRQLLRSCLIRLYFICKRRLKSSHGLNVLMYMHVCE